MAEAAVAPLPIVPYLKIPESGAPYLEGIKCKACSEVFIGQGRLTAGKHVCQKCGAIEQMETVKLGNTGKLYNYTVVHRSFPGVKTPFISAIVDLDGGGSIRGNLINVEPTPEAIKFDTPVKVVYEIAPAKDKEGNSYLSYYFTPA
ncbi:MAG: OB-fold domain-containing protein [Caulobacterales bacterium]